jgi:hypothetical protein
MLEGLQIDPERVVELGNRTGEDDGPPRGVLLYDDKTMSVGELSDGGNVRRISAKLSRKLLAAKMTIRPFAGRQLRHSVFQRVACAVAQYYADFQAFRGICLADGSRSPHWLPFATDKCTIRHR